MSAGAPQALLVSSPNGGGLLLVGAGRVTRLDATDSTGLAIAGGRLLRGTQHPGSMLVYDLQEGDCDEWGKGEPAFADIHDILGRPDGSSIVVSTHHNAISELDAEGRLRRDWRLPGEPDSWHVNCIADWQGRLVVSAFGEFAHHRAYKEFPRGRGLIRDIESGETLISGLSQPHSLVVDGDTLLLANSSGREIRQYDRDCRLIRSRPMGGYTRGLCRVGDSLFVGLSCSRNNIEAEIRTATLIELDAATWEERRRVEIPTREVYAILPVSDVLELHLTIDLLARTTATGSADSAIAAERRRAEADANRADAAMAELASATLRLDETTRQLSLARSDIAEARLQLASRDRELTQTRADLTSTAARLATTTDELAAAREASATRIAALDESLAAARLEITTLLDERAQLNHEIELRLADRRIEQRNTRRAWRAADKARAELIYTAGRKRHREQELRAHAQEIKRLKARLHDQRGTLARIVGSKSWVVTRPLRGLRRGMEWLRGDIRRAGTALIWLASGQIARLESALQLAPRRPTRDATAMLPSGSRASLHFAGATPTGPNTSTDRAPVLDPNASTYGARRAYFYPDTETLRDGIARYRATRTESAPARRIAVFTAIAGDYDGIKLHEHLDPRIDYHLFVDRPVDDVGLFIHHPIDYFNIDPTRAARFVKLHPHLLLADYDIAIWVDGNIIIRGDIGELIEAVGDAALGAVPHPLRTSVFEEAAECTRRSKDEPEIIAEQMARYRAEGFDCADLIESNLLVFNLRHPKLGAFLDTWWRELERGSRRDQLSLNYALARTSLDYVPLTTRPNSVRNHPDLALLAHGAPSVDLRPLALGRFEPLAGPAFAAQRTEVLARQAGAAIDIVICVHNALDDVTACLDSIERAAAGSAQRIILVDDGSDIPTRDFLANWARHREAAMLHRNEVPLGYTRAANLGLSLSTAPFVVLLNSDTVVTSGWAEKLADVLARTPGAGIVGPLSNAASHQSIPDHRSSAGQTAVNALPPGMSAEDMNAFCERQAPLDAAIRTPLAHGFCLGIARAVLDRIGGFDEANFPRGYGEENDFCFRAADAGFGCVVALNTFVFHAKSKSYSSAAREALMKAGNARVHELHGRRRVVRAIRSMQDNPALQRLRTAAAALW